jgi:AraC-like DNA-binding protein
MDGGQERARPQRRERVAAWHPAVPGIAEVLHARFVEHVYPAHIHDTWTLLLVDRGFVRFDLERAEHDAGAAWVTLLPPHVAHTGRAATAAGFHKRVIYLDSTVLGSGFTGPAVTAPSWADPLLRRRVSQLHQELSRPGEELAAESRLALIRARLHEHLRPGRSDHSPRPDRRLADELRDLLDSHLATGLTLRAAGGLLHAHPDHLVRTFSAAFGLPPHRYLTARRVDAARQRLLEGQALSDVAAAVGFHDQAHLSRHFTRQLGVTPGRYARSAITGH